MINSEIQLNEKKLKIEKIKMEYNLRQNTRKLREQSCLISNLNKTIAYYNYSIKKEYFDLDKYEIVKTENEIDNIKDYFKILTDELNEMNEELQVLLSGQNINEKSTFKKYDDCMNKIGIYRKQIDTIRMEKAIFEYLKKNHNDKLEKIVYDLDIKVEEIKTKEPIQESKGIKGKYSVDDKANQEKYQEFDHTEEYKLLTNKLIQYFQCDDFPETINRITQMKQEYNDIQSKQKANIQQIKQFKEEISQLNSDSEYFNKISDGENSEIDKLNEEKYKLEEYIKDKLEKSNKYEKLTNLLRNSIKSICKDNSNKIKIDRKFLDNKFIYFESIQNYLKKFNQNEDKIENSKALNNPDVKLPNFNDFAFGGAIDDMVKNMTLGMKKKF